MKNLDMIEGWKYLTLKEISDPNDRYSFKGGPFGSDLKSAHYTEDGVRVLQLQDIGKGYFLDKSNIYTSVEKADELEACNVYPGDILLAKMSPVARCCIVPATDERFVMCSDGIRLSVDPSKVDRDFVYYALNDQNFLDKAEAKSTGTTRARIGLSDLRSLSIFCPPLAEQQKIAAILSTVDKKINLVDENISQTKHLKIGLRQKLFSEGVGVEDKDGNWLRHKEYVNTPIGQFPINWKLLNLDEIAHINPKPHKLDSDKEKVSFVGMADTSEQSKLISQTTKLYSEVKKGFTSFLENDVLVAKITPCFENGKGAFAEGLINGVGFGSTEFHVIRSIKGVSSSKFIHHLTTSYPFRSKGEMNMTGTAGQKRVSKIFIEKYKIGCPPINEQEKIADILSTVDEKLTLLKEQKLEIQKLKKGLMQKLLTGEWRIPVDDSEAA